MNKAALSKISLYAFCLVSAANLINQLIHIAWIDMLTKPLLVPFLLGFYLTSRSDKPDKLTWLIVGALVFSWIGDVLLMMQGEIEMLFIFGLAAFLFAHLLYIFAFRLAKDKVENKTYTSFIRGRIVFLLLVGAALIYLLFPVLGDLRIPVVIYTGVIIFMAISALSRRGHTSETSFMLVYSGAILFILSDASLGINKFLSPIVYADLLIMGTYILAQFLIIKGIIIHENGLLEEGDSK